MAIKKYTQNGFIHTWSSNNKYILQEDTGRIYAEAYDKVDGVVHTYKETDRDIEPDEGEH